MVDNLRLNAEDMLLYSGTTTITSANSNLPNGTSVSLPSTITSAAQTTDVFDYSYITNTGVNGTYLYNWHVAVAYPNGTTVAVAGLAPTQSICPAGWRIADKNGTKSYTSLINTYPSMSLSVQPMNFVATGIIYNSALQQPDVGNYITRTSNEAGLAYADHRFYTFYARDNDVGISVTGGKLYYYALRCVAQ